MKTRHGVERARQKTRAVRARELGIGGSSAGAIAAALVLPKCPLCVVALLSALGLGGSLVEAAAPVLRPAALAIGVVLAAVLAASLALRRARRRTCGDCARGLVDTGDPHEIDV